MCRKSLRLGNEIMNFTKGKGLTTEITTFFRIFSFCTNIYIYIEISIHKRKVINLIHILITY